MGGLPKPSSGDEELFESQGSDLRDRVDATFDQIHSHLEVSDMTSAVEHILGQTKDMRTALNLALDETSLKTAVARQIIINYTKRHENRASATMAKLRLIDEERKRVDGVLEGIMSQVLNPERLAELKAQAEAEKREANSIPVPFKVVHAH